MQNDRIKNIINSIDDGINEISKSDAIAAISAMFPRFTQVAFYTYNITSTKGYYWNLGCRNWIDDTVTAEGYIGGNKNKETNVAQLAFNYDLGVELELITYLAGNNWHKHCGRLESDSAFPSHMSYHVTGAERAELTRKFVKCGWPIVQDVTTISHTNNALISSGKRYRYVVFNSRVNIGFDIKLIERIEPSVLVDLE